MSDELTTAFIDALRKALLNDVRPPSITDEDWSFICSHKQFILSKLEPADEEHPGWFYTQENYNNTGSLLVDTPRGQMFLPGVTIEMFCPEAGNSQETHEVVHVLIPVKRTWNLVLRKYFYKIRKLLSLD